MIRYLIGEETVEVPTEVAAKGLDSVRNHVLDRACPTGNGDEPLEEADWLLPFDPRNVNADEMEAQVADLDDLQVLGNLRALEGRTTARRAIEERIDEVLNREEA